MFPVIVKLFLAFRSVNVVQFLLSLSFVTFQGMIISYLVAADTRRAFEVPLAELRLKDGQ